MLFFILVIALIIGIVCWIVGDILYRHTRYDTEWLRTSGEMFTVAMTICMAVNGVIFAYSYIGVDAKVAENMEIYESLTYQLDNNIYDNDNDLGKKELYDQIQEWNEDLAYYQAIQDDFWVGIYFPDIFDQFEFIELRGGE